MGHIWPIDAKRKQFILTPMSHRKLLCPVCDNESGVRIVYGYPSEELVKAAEQRKVVLGGCMQYLDAPKKKCIRCEHEW